MLGSAIARILSEQAHIIPLAHSNRQPGMDCIDLLDHHSLSSLANREWNILIHCAAFRDPDFCEKNTEQARALNTLVPKALSEIANERGAKMIQISTDYVFDGNSPPYTEESSPAPINHYGKTKMEAEQWVRDICPESIIVRMPVLYGNATPPVQSTFIEGAIGAISAGKSVEMDNSITRRPTFTDDVAKAIGFLIESNFEGTIHVSAEETTTNYQWARFIATLTNKDPSIIKTMKAPLCREALRPQDSSLSVNRLKEINGPIPRSFKNVLPDLDRIKEFL